MLVGCVTCYVTKLNSGRFVGCVHFLFCYFFWVLFVFFYSLVLSLNGVLHRVSCTNNEVTNTEREREREREFVVCSLCLWTVKSNHFFAFFY